jgi:hypothetical protein
LPNHRRIYCNDCTCPAAPSCARYWGRSKEYGRRGGGPDEARNVKLMKYPRDPLLDHCIAYVPCGPMILHELPRVAEIGRKHRITGIPNLVWTFLRSI